MQKNVTQISQLKTIIDLVSYEFLLFCNIKKLFGVTIISFDKKKMLAKIHHKKLATLKFVCE